MLYSRKFPSATILFILATLISSDIMAYSQSKQPGNANLFDNIDQRINKQTIKINRNLIQGLLTHKQAAQLRTNLQNIAKEAQSGRKLSGALSQTQLTKLDSQLKQNFNNLNTQISSNKRSSESGQVLGPDWMAGKDGAQNPRKLRQQMKSQEKHQLEQYDQAMQQVQELHQQEYEKEMLKKLGQQRPAILQNKQDVQQIRKDTGAN